MEFSISMDIGPPDAVITVGGELDVFTARHLAARLDEAMESGCLRVLMDLTGVTFVDASALRVIERFRRRYAEVDGHLQFVAWSPRFYRVCRLTGLDATFRLIDIPMAV